MSAVNIFPFRNEIIAWTDGALYEADGTLFRVTSKIGLLPHLNAIVCVRGPALAYPLLTHQLGTRFCTFDDLVADLSEAVADAIDRHALVWEICSHGPNIEVFVAGFSERDGAPRLYRVGSDREGVVAEMPMCIAPATEEVIAAMQTAFPGADDEVFATFEAGMKLIELQRETVRLEQVAGMGAICAVGGFAQLTVLTREGVSTRIVKRWPDRLGEKMGQ